MGKMVAILESMVRSNAVIFFDWCLVKTMIPVFVSKEEQIGPGTVSVGVKMWLNVLSTMAAISNEILMKN